ncbi:hypothetical protein CF65_01253 [Aggregatibacter actinomycetemcomitans HK1651]|nr:hypothetical protein CF65_01253 [Aggregatibacter actinomycetemcomitans HK1651]
MRINMTGSGQRRPTVSSVWVIFILSIFVIYYEKLRGIIQ